MSAQIKSITDQMVTIELTVDLKSSMLETEEAIQESLNEAGCLATKVGLEQFDTDGSPIEIGHTRWTSKNKEDKCYQTPYGEIIISRHVYQTSKGGKTFCPLDQNARIIIHSSPRFAKQVSSKYALLNGRQVVEDFFENHSRQITHAYVQHISEAIGSIAQAKEESWHYSIPELKESISTIAIGLDGTCMLLSQEGYRLAMVGTLSLYNKEGERQHSIYLGATPEYGKASFLKRLEYEINELKKHYPKAVFIGVADGASDNWSFLNKQTEYQILDFFHATEYLGEVAKAVFKNKEEREDWLDNKCHQLKHKNGAATRILNEIIKFRKQKFSKAKNMILDKTITYFKNQKHRMKYAKFQQFGFPIGSGVTEAACKTLVKQRLCASGMRWKEKGASIVLSLRALVLTTKRWSQFWNKINQYGCSALT